MTSFVALKPHLQDAERVAQLKQIEAKLREHEFPPQLVVENTSYCNLKCIHCSHKEMKRPNAHMDLELWIKIVAEVGRTAPETELWPTFYGEAFILGDRLWERLSIADASGCRNLVLNSNGTLLLRNDNIEKVLDSPLKRFIISLDGLSRATFEKIRFRAKHAQVYPAVEKLLQRRAERGQSYPVITAQFSVMKDNAAEAEAFRTFWSERGAEIKIRPMMEWTATGSVRSETIIHDTQMRIACPWAINTMAIHQSGDAVACAVDYEGRFTVGNVRESSIKELWGRLGQSLRRVHLNHEWDKLPELCRGCGDWQVAGAQYDDAQLPGTRPFWIETI